MITAQHYPPKTNMRLIATGTGILVIVWSVLIYTRLSMFDPFAAFVPGCRMCTLGIAATHHIVVLYSLARAVRATSTHGALAAAGAAILLIFALRFLLPTNGTNFTDALRITVGQHAWWLALLLAALLTTSSWNLPEKPLHWKNLWFGSGAIWVSGMILYISTPGGNWATMLTKTVFILIIPAITLTTTAIYYRGRLELAVRLIAVTVLCLPVAVATLN